LGGTPTRSWSGINQQERRRIRRDRDTKQLLRETRQGNKTRVRHSALLLVVSTKIRTMINDVGGSIEKVAVRAVSGESHQCEAEESRREHTWYERSEEGPTAPYEVEGDDEETPRVHDHPGLMRSLVHSYQCTPLGESASCAAQSAKISARIRGGVRNARERGKSSDEKRKRGKGRGSNGTNERTNGSLRFS